MTITNKLNSPIRLVGFSFIPLFIGEKELRDNLSNVKKNLYSNSFDIELSKKKIKLLFIATYSSHFGRGLFAHPYDKPCLPAGSNVVITNSRCNLNGKSFSVIIPYHKLSLPALC